MGRFFGALNFNDKSCNTTSNLFKEIQTPFEWLSKRSFKYDFFHLLRLSPPTKNDTYFVNKQDLFLFLDGQIVDDDNQTFGTISADGGNTLLNRLIAIYREQGPEHLSGLNGMYLIVVWDKTLKTLFIANDILGLKPCYYWFYANELFFGTQYEPITRHPKFSKNISNEALIELMIMGCVLEDHTLFKSIKCLEPGCLLTCKVGYVNVKKQSQLKFSDSRWGMSSLHLIDEMSDILGKAVQKRLKSSGSTLIPLSGGLDSRILAGFCTKYCSNITTLTYGLRKHMDVKVARKIAKNLNLTNIFYHQNDDFLQKYGNIHIDITESSSELLTANIMPVLEVAQDNYQDIVIAYPGDGLHGENYSQMIKNMKKNGTSPEDSLFYGYYAKKLSPNTLKKYLSNTLKSLVDIPGDTIKNFFYNVDGNILHKCLLTDIYYRYRHYISSQVNLLEDCAHIQAPFTDIDYMNFILTLPPVAFENKYLYKQMIASTFPQLSYLIDANSGIPPGLSKIELYKKSFAHRIWLALETRADFLLEIPQQLFSHPHQIRIKSSMWDTYNCVQEPHRIQFGNLVRGLYDYLEQFFDISAIESLFFSKTDENLFDHSLKVRRIYGFSLWLKRYFT